MRRGVVRIELDRRLVRLDRRTCLLLPGQRDAEVVVDPGAGRRERGRLAKVLGGFVKGVAGGYSAGIMLLDLASATWSEPKLNVVGGGPAPAGRLGAAACTKLGAQPSLPTRDVVASVAKQSR